jgi:serine/threonine protein phosphatase PrpC
LLAQLLERLGIRPVSRSETGASAAPSALSAEPTVEEPLPEPPTVGRLSTAWRQRAQDDDWPRSALTADFGCLGDFTLIGASHVGRSHANEGKHRQDAYGFTLADESLICAVADGVSASKFGGPAADVAISHLLAALDGRFHPQAGPLTEGRLCAAIEHARRAVSGLANDIVSDRAGAMSECATTLAVAALRLTGDGHLQVTCASVGDSGVLSMARGGRFDALVGGDAEPGGGLKDFLPKSGSEVRAVTVELPQDTMVLLCTDGLIRDLELSETVRGWIADQLPRVASPTAAGHVLSYVRQGSADDRTYLAADVSGLRQ